MSTDAFLSMFGAREAHEPRDPMKAAQSAMRAAAPKRFWSEAAIAPSEGSFQLLLDGKPARSPARNLLRMPSRRLAEALAAEWRAQGERIDPAAMPLTRLMNAALDGVSLTAEAVRAEIVAFAGSDLVCYRAEAPEALATLQAKHWDPVLDWAQAALGARFVLAAGVIHVAQPQPSIARIAAAVAAFERPLALAALASATTLTGSCLIALALANGALTPDAAWEAGHVDESYQAQVWGRDEEAEERMARRRADFDAAALALTDGLRAD